jgi:hypothetical protein
LGDNIANIGAIRYLLEYYAEIYFVCHDNSLKNLEILYTNKRVHFIPTHCNNESVDYHAVLDPIYDLPDTDVLISGFCFTPFYATKITNTKLINRKKLTNYRIQPRYDFIRIFYEHINLDLSIYYNYFNIESTKQSIDMYNLIKNYTIIFTHAKCSLRTINLDTIVQKHITDNNKIIICSDHNVYPPSHPHYEIANKFINQLVAYYIDIIKQSKYIYIIDSCFSPIVLPLLNSGQLQTIECQIFHRDDDHIIDWN